jgi:hypothetical protein
MPSPIHLHTVADLLARNHTLQLDCLRCDRWRQAPLGHRLDGTAATRHGHGHRQ